MRNPNDSHPIHGAQGASNVSSKQRGVDGNLPLDLMRMRMRDVRGGGTSGGISPDYLEKVLTALQRRSNFNQQQFAFGLNVLRLRPYEERAYLFLQNVDPAATLFVGFGTTPSTTSGVNIFPNGGFYEPFQVPQNEIYIIGSAAGTGVIITAGLTLAGHIPTELSESEA